MNAKVVLSGLLTGLAACCAQAVTTIEGISTVAPGFEEWRWVMANPNESEWSQALGRKADGTEITMDNVTRAELEAQIEAGGHIEGFSRHVTEGKMVACGYTIENKGDFNYDGFNADFVGGTDGGYPIENRYDRWKTSFFRVKGTISVPSDGKWTFAIGANEYTILSLAITGHGVDFLADITPDWTGHHLYTLDLVAGEYEMTFNQFRDNESCWYEISAAKGEKTAFDSGSFHLIGAPLTTCTVSFDSAGGTSIDPQVVASGRTAIRPTDPTQAGKSFLFWTADEDLTNPTEYDFSAAVTEDLQLTAVWTGNDPPTIESVTASSTAVKIAGSSADFGLSVSATDSDGDELTYSWSLVGEAPAPFTVDDLSAEAPQVTVLGPGTFAFKVVVSDGHDSVEGTVSVVVTLAPGATAFTSVGAEITADGKHLAEKNYNPSLADYPWTDTKAAWRSTGTERKAFLLDAKRENAYGLDGYVFPGCCEYQDGSKVYDVTSGEVAFDEAAKTLSYNKVTEYIESMTLVPDVTRGYTETTVCDLSDEGCVYCIDDPSLPLASEVKDFRPGAMAVHVSGQDVFTPFATLKFSSKVGNHPRIRIGFLSGYDNKFKPEVIAVGAAVAPCTGNRTARTGMPDWVFFDIDNAKAGDEVVLSVKQTDNQWQSARIEGIVFDSEYKELGFSVILR